MDKAVNLEVGVPELSTCLLREAWRSGDINSLANQVSVLEHVTHVIGLQAFLSQLLLEV